MMRSSRRAFLKQVGSAALLPAVQIKRSLGRAEDDVRSRLAADPLRPQFHLLPDKNWMNDPNGPIFWNGHYHMFFQYNPNAAVWGDMHWAHAKSDDMVHWRHLPVALAPTPNGEDADGCFTGSAVDDGGTATIIYTGVKTAPPERATLRDGINNFREVQCLATSTDSELRTWTKLEQPILEPPSDPQLTGFRDPFLWREGETWYLGVGSGRKKEGGCALLYRSRDLRHWEYLHPLAAAQWTGRESTNPVESGEMWECPDFFPLGGKHVLLYSTAGKVIWETGELDRNEMRFHPERSGVLDHGAYYAQKTQLDAHGNRILWGWIPETRPQAEYSAAGWAGCMSVPRVLTLSTDGELQMEFAPQVKSLRAKAFRIAASKSERLGDPARLRDTQIENLCGEFAWRTAAPEFTLELVDNSGTWSSIQVTAQKLTVNGAWLDLPASHSEREFHLYLDASVAELICDRKHAITTRIYRKPKGPLHPMLGDDELTQFHFFNGWQLRPISRNRLTS